MKALQSSFILLFFFCNSNLSSQVTFVKQFSNGTDILKCTGLYNSNKPNELAIGISNYSSGKASIVLVDRSGKQKLVGTLALSNPYIYVTDLVFFNDTIYGCGNSNTVIAEQGCSGSQAKGFYFKWVLNRTNPNNLTGTFAWIKEDVLASDQGSFYTKLSVKDNLNLYLTGSTYSSGYTGCSGAAKGSVTLVNEKNGAKVITKRIQSDFTSISDLVFSNNELYLHTWDWRVYSNGNSYMTLVKLDPNTLTRIDSAHYLSYYASGTVAPGNLPLPKSLLDEGSTFVTASGFATDPHNVDLGFSVYRINKSSLQVVNQINIPVTNSTYLSFGQLVRYGTGYILFFANRMTTSSTDPDLVRLIQLDNNLNIIKHYDFTSNLFAGHSLSISSSTLVVQNDDVFLYTNKSGKVELNRLDFNIANTNCYQLGKITVTPSNKYSVKEKFAFGGDNFELSSISASPSTSTVTGNVTCLTCKLTIRIDSVSTTSVDSMDYTASVVPASGNYTFNWYDNTTNQFVLTGKKIRIHKTKVCKVKIEEGDFVNCRDSLTTKSAVAPSGISAQILDEIILFPNPTQNFLNIIVPEKSHINIFNSRGSLESNIQINETTNNIEMYVGELARGLYFIEVTGQSTGYKKQLKFIKD